MPAASQRAIRFSNSTLSALEPPAAGRVEYQDLDETGLRLRVSASGDKVFTMLRRVEGKLQRLTLGAFLRKGDTAPRMSVDAARKAKRKADGAIASGENPNQAKKASRVRGRSVGDWLAEYLKDNTKLKDRTRSDYANVLREFCHDWLAKPLSEITREAIKRRHAKHGADHSEARANNAVRVLRALFYYAGIEPNPAANPKKKGQGGAFLFDDKRKRTRIMPKQMPAWWAAVAGLSGKRSDSGAATASDLLTLLLLTGLRASEACGLLWQHVDVEEGLFVVPDPKNRDPHELPLGTLLHRVLKARHASRDRQLSPYVFAAKESPDQPYSYNTLRGWLASVAADSGVRATAHDCRRTFTSIAESLDISSFTVKRLINHRTGRGDVTDGYVIITTERLREAMQRIENEVLRQAEQPL